MQIVFDIGGTKLRIAQSLNGSELSDVRVFPTPQSYAEGLALLIEQAEALAGNQKITAIAGGVPAILDNKKTAIVRAANLPDWSEKSFGTDLETHFNCPIKLENDGILGGLGEAVLGAGKDFESVAYITIGTGIGGAWIVNKQLAGEGRSFDPGHHIIDPNGPKCPSDGEAGHWEAYIKQADFERYLAIGLYNTLLFWPADVLVLGGGVTLHSSWDLQALSTELRTLIKDPALLPEIKIAELGDNAGLHGALLLLK